MKGFRRFLVLALVPMLLISSAAFASPPQWEWLSPLPQLNHLFGVIYGRDQFVAVGASGTIITSADGIEWTVQVTDTSLPLTAVDAGPGLFVAAGGADNTSAVILTSADGHAWTRRYTLEKASISRVAHDGAHYVAVGWSIETSGDLDGLILVSLDGQDWRRVKSPVPNRLLDVTYANGRFLATDGNHILTSADGDQWSVHPLPDEQAVYQLLYTGTGYLGMGARTTSPGFSERALYRSGDGETWDRVPIEAAGEIRGYRSIAASGSGYLLLGATSRDTGIILSSPDAANWSPSYESDGSLNSMTCGKLRCVAVGSLGAIVTSPDGVTWTPLAEGQPQGYGDIAYGAGRFVVTARAFTMTSANGVNWTKTPWPEPYQFLGPVIYGRSQFVAIGRGNSGRVLYTSTDGVTWRPAYEHPGVAFFGDLVYGNGRYVVTFGNAVSVISSADLVSWTPSTNLRAMFANITFGKGLFVGASDTGILTSPDGITWSTAAAAEQDGHLSGVAYGDGRFVAVGSDIAGTAGVMLTSLDGQTWTRLTPDPTSPLQGVVHGNGLFVAWGPRVILTSSDGVNWTSSPNRAGEASLRMAYGSGRFIALSGLGPVMAATVCGSVFPDVPAANPACAAIEQMAKRQVIAGFPDGNFRPEQTVTRAELAKMLVAALGKHPDAAAPRPFADATGHWAARAGYLQTAFAIKAISGFPDGTFRPDDPVTRSQIIKMAAAAAGLVADGSPPYADIREQDWFSGWVAAAHRAPLIGPDALNPLWSGPDFAGDQAVTRAEAAMLLHNLGGVH